MISATWPSRRRGARRCASRDPSPDRPHAAPPHRPRHRRGRRRRTHGRRRRGRLRRLRQAGVVLPARRRLGRPAARRGPDLDPGHPDRPGAARLGPGQAGHRALGGRHGPAVPQGRPQRRVRDRPEPRPHGQGRREGAEAGDLVLLPLPAPRPARAGSAAPARPRARRDAGPPALRRGVLRQPAGRAGSPRTARSLGAPTCTPSSTWATTSTSTRPGQYGYGFDETDIRPHEPAHEMVSLADYRQRHAQYKTDADLQDLHAAYPWIITWDDHEVTNDQWAAGAENHTPATEGDYAARRARSHRAYDEWMPVRMDGTARLQRRRPALPPAALRPAGRGQHARPAQLPQRAGADDVPRRRCRPPRPRSATRRAPSPASSRCSGSRTRSTGSARSGR